MKHVSFRSRALSFMTLVTLVSQIASPFLPTTYALNNSYYIDATDGSDLADGLSPATAWQTLSMASFGSGGYSEGDQILLECGESWNETLALSYSGAEGNPIVYSSYGTCNGSNDPVIVGTGGNTISENGEISYVELHNIVSSGGLVSFTGISMSTQTGIVLENITMMNPGSTCMTQNGDKNITISGSTFDSCDNGLTLWYSGAIMVKNSIFQDNGYAIFAGAANILGSSLLVEGNTFNDIAESAITFTTNTTIDQNTFTNICTVGTDCAAITNTLGSADGSNITNNVIMNVGTGILSTGSHDGIRLTSPAFATNISGNTISNAMRSIVLTDVYGTTVTNNTLFHPRTEALLITETIINATQTNTISNNTITAYNPDYSMIKIDDQVDASGSLATLSNNKYINVYKPKLPLVLSLHNGGLSSSYTKADISTFDLGASTFGFFGYKVYTSTGSAGANLLSNGTFTSDVIGWTGSGNSLVHDNTGGTLHASQGGAQMGTITSDNFSMTAGATYEISGTLKNLSGTGGKHVAMTIRQDILNVLYADRVVDAIATGSGMNFSAYVTANTTAADAQLVFFTTSAFSDIELDNLVVRQVTGLTRNPRTNEVRLMVNTGSTSGNFSCPGGGGCSLQYRDITDTAVAFPVNIVAHSSQIILWRDPNSNFTPTNILHKPNGTFVPSAGSIANNESVDLSWTSNNATNVLMSGSTNTGGFTYILGSSGAVTIFPPNDGTNTYTLSLENDIGFTTYTADVVTSNTPPVTVPSFATGSEDALSITGAVTATDINSGGSLSYSLFDPPAPSFGTLTAFNGDGTYDFQPTANFCGDGTFTFRAFDGFGMGSDGVTPGVATVTVICTNDAPTAIDDSVTATGGAVNLFDVLANETDIDSPYEVQTFSLTGFTNPVHGTLSISGTMLEFIADPFYIGSDSFLYTMVDQSGGLSNTGTVTINIIPGSNVPPISSGDSHTVTEDTPYTATMSGYDFNPGDILTFTTSLLPSAGTITISGADFTYTPNLNYNGSDTFDFVISDGALTSSSATISLTITGTMDAPMLGDDTVNVQMATPTILDVMNNDNDPDSPYTPQTLTITGLTSPSNGTAVIVGTGVQYTSSASYLGPDSFSYMLIDQDANLSSTATVNITVSSSNTPPLAYSGNLTTNEDAPFVGTLSGYDADGTPLTFLMNTNGSNGTVSIGSTGGYVYTPNLNYSGTDSFSYRVSDGVFTSASEVMSVTITSVNDAPVTNNDTATGTEDTGLLISNMLANDTDVDGGDILSLQFILTQGTKGMASISGATEVIYSPIANQCGMDSFTYQITDQSGALSGTGNVTVNLICTNDAPTLSGASYGLIGNIATNSGRFVTGTLLGSDIDLDVLSYILSTNVTNGVLAFNTGGTFTYTPNLGFSGSDNFTFQVSDGTVTVGTGTIAITVTPNTFNTPPVATDDSATGSEDVVLIVTPLTNDTDIDVGDVLTLVSITQPLSGGTALIAGNNIQITPTANYCGSNTLTYRARDSVSNLSNTGTVSFTFTCVNDAPTVGNASYLMTGNVLSGTLMVLMGTLSGSDIEGAVLTFTGTTASTGALTITSTGGFSYTPPNSFVGSATFTYQADDGSGGISSAGTISVCVVSPNALAALPGCAPVVIAPVITGNGGGGGGGGSSNGTALSSSDSVGSSAGVSSALLSQLLLGRIFNTETSTGNIRNNPPSSLAMTFQNETVMEIPELLDNISSVLEYSREFEESSGDNVADIRFSGRDILTAVSINETLTESDKADTLRASAKRLQEYLSPKPFAREYKALQYVIRILSTREAFIRDTIDSVDTFFDSL